MKIACLLFVLTLSLSCLSSPPTRNGHVRGVEIVPTPRHLRDVEGVMPLDAGTAIVVAADAAEPVRYAAEAIRDHCCALYGVELPIVPPDGGRSYRSSITVSEMPRATEGGPEGFAIRPSVGGDRKSVAVLGNGPLGVVYGATTLFQLMEKDESGRGFIRCAAVEDWPAVPLRAHYVLTHRLGEAIGSWENFRTGAKTIPGELMPKGVRDDYLDWLVRHRSNLVYYETGHSVPLPPDLDDLVKESHRRGMLFFAGIRYIAGSGDNRTYLCYTDEKDVQTVLDIYRKYLELGVDGVAYLADDIRKEHIKGHCERCIAKFGGLAGEQVFMLRKIAELMKERNLPLDRLYFCPTPYSVFTPLKDKPEFQSYYKAFADDGIARQIPFFLTYYDKEQVQGFKNAFGLKYLWWYNGPRPYKYWYRGRGEKKLVYPADADPMYYPLFYGWGGIPITPGSPPEAASDDVKKIFRDIRNETEVFWMCNGGYDGIGYYEYSHAIWGHYAWNPDAFDQMQSERAIFEILYGKEGYLLLKELNDLCHRAAMIFFPDAVKPEEVVSLCKQAESALEKLEKAWEAHRKATGGKPATASLYAGIGLKQYRQAIELMRKQAEKR